MMWKGSHHHTINTNLNQKKLFNKILKIMEKNMFYQMCKDFSLFLKLLKPLSPQQKNNSSE
jgi:hypothetical protein